MSKILSPFQLLELNIISAQDLAHASRSMRTYAVAWVHPDRKLSTRVDTHGDNNPTWNDKFVFRVDEDFLHADTSAVMIEIYALHWFRDVHVGTVRVLVGNLIPTPPRPHTHTQQPQMGMRFVALQVRRPSGRPQGILNIGVAVLDSSMRSMPLYTHLNTTSAFGYRNLMGEEDPHLHHHQKDYGSNLTPTLRRTKSDTSSVIASELRTTELRGGPHKSSKGKKDSEVGSKKKKGRSKTSSLISGSTYSFGNRNKRYKNKKSSSIVCASDVSMHPTKNGQSSSVISGSEVSMDPSRTGKIGKPSSIISGSDQGPNGNGVDKSGKPSSVINGSDAGDPASPTHKKVTLNDKPLPYIESSHDTESETTASVDTPVVKVNKKYNMDFVAPHVRGTTPMHARGTPLNARATPAKSFTKFNGLMEYGTPRRSTLMDYGTTPRKFGEHGTPRKTNIMGGAAFLTESELGPSPSEVAAEMAKTQRVEEEGSSIVGGWSLDESVEGLQSKLERWRTELPPVYDRGEFSSIETSEGRHSRRHTDGGSGLFSCFSNICGCQCQIVCGGGPGDAKKKGANNSGVQRTSSAGDVSYV